MRSSIFIFAILSLLVSSCGFDYYGCDIETLDHQKNDLLSDSVTNIVIGFGQSNMCCADQLANNGLDSVFYYKPQTGLLNADPEGSLAVYFADELSTRQNKAVYVVNIGRGGTFLCKGEEDWSHDSGEGFFIELVEQINEVKSLVSSQGHQNIRIIGLWAQGDSDTREDGCTRTYQINESCLINELRVRMGMVFPMVSYLVKTNTTGFGNGNGDDVNAAKIENSELHKEVYLVDPRPSEYESDNIHLTEEGKQQAALLGIDAIFN